MVLGSDAASLKFQGSIFEGVLKTSDQLVGILNLDKVLAMYD